MNALFIMIVLSIAIIIMTILCLHIIFTHLKMHRVILEKNNDIRSLELRIQKLEKGRK